MLGALQHAAAADQQNPIGGRVVQLKGPSGRVWKYHLREDREPTEQELHAMGMDVLDREYEAGIAAKRKDVVEANAPLHDFLTSWQHPPETHAPPAPPRTPKVTTAADQFREILPGREEFSRQAGRAGAARLESLREQLMGAPTPESAGPATPAEKGTPAWILGQVARKFPQLDGSQRLLAFEYARATNADLAKVTKLIAGKRWDEMRQFVGAEVLNRPAEMIDVAKRIAGLPFSVPELLAGKPGGKVRTVSGEKMPYENALRLALMRTGLADAKTLAQTATALGMGAQQTPYGLPQLDALTQLEADLADQVGYGKNNVSAALQAPAAVFQLFPHLLREGVAGAMGLERGQVTENVLQGEDLGAEIGRAGDVAFGFGKYFTPGGAASIAADASHVAGRTSQVGAGEAIGEAAQGLAAAMNVFEKGIDVPERVARGLNLGLTLLTGPHVIESIGRRKSFEQGVIEISKGLGVRYGEARQIAKAFRAVADGDFGERDFLGPIKDRTGLEPNVELGPRAFRESGVVTQDETGARFGYRYDDPDPFRNSSAADAARANLQATLGRAAEGAKAVTPEDQDAFLSLVDAAGSVWARETARPIEDWYRLFDVKFGGDQAAALEAVKGRTGEQLFQGEVREGRSPYGRFGTPFYSKLLRVVQEKMGGVMDGVALRRMLENNGVKPEEIEWTRMDEVFGRGKVTKDEVLEHLLENSIAVEDVVRGAIPWHSPITADLDAQIADLNAQLRALNPRDDRGWEIIQKRLAPLRREHAARIKPTKFAEYSLPGGKDYRELQLTLPVKNPSDNVFKSAHWGEPNVLAHIRFDTREGPNGEKILHIAEIQSDWHQRGRKEGYDGDIPDAPFKKTWHELALKRITRYATENGFDRITWDAGATQSDRYDLSHHVSMVAYIPPAPGQGKGRIFADNPGGDQVIDKVIDHDALPDYIGKDAADRLLSRPPDAQGVYRLEGGDLRVSGEGMSGFYDRILPSAANKLYKKYGVKVEPTGVGEKGHPAHGFDITSRLKAAVTEGQPLFQAGAAQVVGEKIKGMVEFGLDGKATITLFEAADFTTLAHEFAHVLRRHMPLRGRAKASVERWAGAREGWTRDAEEKWARAFERYVREGKAPTAELGAVFEYGRQRLLETYKQIKGSPLEVKLTPGVRKVFDRMLGQEPPVKALKAPETPTIEARPAPEPIPRVITDEQRQDPFLGEKSRIRDFQAIAEELGIEAPPAHVESWEQWMQEAELLRQKGDIVETLKDKRASKQVLSPAERAAAKMEAIDLRQAMREVQDKMKAAADARDEIVLKELEDQYSAMRHRMTDLAGAAMDLGSESGRALAAHRMVISEVYDTYHGDVLAMQERMLRHAEQTARRALTEGERSNVVQGIEDLASAEDMAVKWRKDRYKAAKTQVEKQLEKIGRTKIKLSDLEGC